jgi:rhamnose utilization protein RhaD (predicted bifunctional aldolase and dehydrogenase)
MLAGIKESDISSLVDMSARIGQDPLLVQAGTGNTSIKLDGVLWIKASGKWLADAQRDELFVPVDLSEARRAVKMKRDIAETHTGGLRPSIETAMHAVLPHRVVIHAHSINTIAWAVRHDGPQQVADRLAGLLWRWIPYVPSGIALASAIERDLAGSPGADVFVLANHGLVVCGDSVEDAEALLREVDGRLAIGPRRAPAPAYGPLIPLTDRSEWRLPDIEELHALGTDPVSRRIISKGTLYPCQAMFFGRRSRFQIVEGCGIVVHEEITRTETAMLIGLMEVAQRVDRGAPVRYLTDAEVLGVLNADVYGLSS